MVNHYEIAEDTLDVEGGRLPEQTITREEYMALGGIPVSEELEVVYDTANVSGSVAGNRFTFNRSTSVLRDRRNSGK